MKAAWVAALFTGCALAPACQDTKSAEDCRAELAEINAGCAARKLACIAPGCEDVIAAECDQQIDEACK